MPEPTYPEGTSIADVLKQGLETTPEGGDGASPDAGGDKQPDGDGKPAPEAGKDPVNPDAPAKDPQDPGNKGTEPEKGKDPVDPPKQGEYTKERFDGLMSLHQKQQSVLQKQIDDLKSAVESKGQPAEANNNPDEIDIPDELKDADPEAQQGYKVVARGVNKMLEKVEKRITGKILDIMNQPLKKENELKTAVDNEIAELKVSLGPEFEKNIKDVLKFAADEGYQQGSLGLAFKNWKRNQDHAAEIAKLGGAKKKIDEIKEEDRNNAGIPTGGKNKTGEIPVFDAERDGNKSISEILRESADLL